MLWIALHLPLLSLESFSATLPAAADGAGEGPPIALMDAHRIVSANASAQALGVKSGLKRATALALAPTLMLAQADAARDALAVTSVAHAALAFTPAVCFEPAEDPADAPHTVLLEVHASLRYFGGLQALLRRLRAALKPLKHAVHCASAPTAKGAAWLARIGEPPAGRHAADLRSLNRMLDDVPVWLPGPGQAHWDALQGMGLRTLSDLQGLPRSGLARRFGEVLLDDIDRARRIDPRARGAPARGRDRRASLRRPGPLRRRRGDCARAVPERRAGSPDVHAAAPLRARCRRRPDCRPERRDAGASRARRAVRRDVVPRGRNPRRAGNRARDDLRGGARPRRVRD